MRRTICSIHAFASQKQVVSIIKAYMNNQGFSEALDPDFKSDKEDFSYHDEARRFYLVSPEYHHWIAVRQNDSSGAPEGLAVYLSKEARCKVFWVNRTEDANLLMYRLVDKGQLIESFTAKDGEVLESFNSPYEIPFKRGETLVDYFDRYGLRDITNVYSDYFNKTIPLEVRKIMFDGFDDFIHLKFKEIQKQNEIKNMDAYSYLARVKYVHSLYYRQTIELAVDTLKGEVNNQDKLSVLGENNKNFRVHAFSGKQWDKDIFEDYILLEPGVNPGIEKNDVLAIAEE